MKKKIIIAIILGILIPLVVYAATILEDCFETGSFNGNWTETESNGTVAVTAGSKKEGSYGMDCDFSISSQTGSAYISESYTANDTCYIRFWFYPSSTGSIAASSRTTTTDNIARIQTNATRVLRIGIYDDGDLKIWCGWFNNGTGSYVYFTDQTIAEDTWYEIKALYYSVPSGTFPPYRQGSEWWVDQVSIGTGSGLAWGDIPPNYAHFGWTTETTNTESGELFYDCCGIFTTDPGHFSGVNNKINGVETNNLSKINGVSKSNIGKVNGVDWQ